MMCISGHAMKRDAAQLWNSINTFEKIINLFQPKSEENFGFNKSNDSVDSNAVQYYTCFFLNQEKSWRNSLLLNVQLKKNWRKNSTCKNNEPLKRYGSWKRIQRDLFGHL